MKIDTAKIPEYVWNVVWIAALLISGAVALGLLLRIFLWAAGLLPGPPNPC